MSNFKEELFFELLNVFEPGQEKIDNANAVAKLVNDVESILKNVETSAKHEETTFDEDNENLIDFSSPLSRQDRIDQTAHTISNMYNSELNSSSISETNKAFITGFINRHCERVAKKIITLNST